MYNGAAFRVTHVKTQTIHVVVVFFCSHKALSQMSTSVVEVWQPEDADPLVPLQVITVYFLGVFGSN